MYWPLALMTTVILLGLSLILTPYAHFDLTWIMVPATAFWAAFDSKKIGLTRYKSGLSVKPGIVFLGIILLWIIVFPWYLIVRGRILTGKQPLKEQATPATPVTPAPQAEAKDLPNT